MARKKSSEKICITFFKKIQSNAIKRGLSFDLDIDYLWDLFLKQNTSFKANPYVRNQK